MDQQKQEINPTKSQPSVGFTISENQSLIQYQEDDSSKMNITNIILNSPLSNLNEFYDLETSLFKKRIERLNLKFFWETENLASQKTIPNPYNKLFLILFKEINLYTDEIVRLNTIIKEKSKNEKVYKSKIDEFSKKEKERLLTKQLLKNCQKTNKALEKKLNDKIKNEEKIKAEMNKIKSKNLSLNNSTFNNSMYNTLTIPSANTSLYTSTTTIKKKNNNNYSTKASHSIEQKLKKKNHFGSFTTPNIKNGHKNNSIDDKAQNLYKNHNNIRVSNFNYNSNDNLGLFATLKQGDDMLYDDDILNEFNDDVLNSCMNHFDSEVEILNKLEDFLEKKKKDIRDTFTKSNFNSLKTTLKKIS